VRVLHEWRPAVPPLPLSRFSGLRALTLCCVCNNDRNYRALLDINKWDGSALDMLSHLPVGLEVCSRCAVIARYSHTQSRSWHVPTTNFPTFPTVCECPSCVRIWCRLPSMFTMTTVSPRSHVAAY